MTATVGLHSVSDMSHSECTHEASKSARARCRRQRNATVQQPVKRLSDAELSELMKLSEVERNDLAEETRVQLYAYLVRMIES